MTMKEEYTAIDMATAAADGFRAGQRAAQSAGVPDGLFLADALLMWNRRHDNPPIHVGYEYGVANALLQMLATPTVKAEQGTTSDQYRAELYDEVWQKARDMGYGNITDALVELERMKTAPSLPAAGFAVESPTVVAYGDPKAFKNLRIDGHKGAPYNHEWMWAAPAPGLVPMIELEQHNRIVAALSAQQSAPERVSVPKRQTLNNLARDGELIASGWNACLDEFNRLNPSIEQVSSLLEWAVSRWEAEVSLRPLHNVHRRPLDDTWRQVIRRIGGNDKALCGPTHDELLASHPRGEA